MILAGRRSSDKVPSLLAHSAGTRKQKRPFGLNSRFFMGEKCTFLTYTVVAVYITRKDAGQGSGKKLTLIFLTNRWNYTGKFVY
ncbi:MAG: hypothetical protein EGP73_05460 [Alistipes indistinctus]|nr:hypothetical protein [Alistipes indistinctus]